MQVASDGTLSLAPGSPVATGHSGGLFSLAAYPPKTSYSISAAPSTLTVGAGGTAKYSVTVAALGGTFNNSVALSCALPQELTSASCAFSNASVTPGGHSATSTLTVGTTRMSAGLMPASPERPADRWLAIWLHVPGFMLGMALIGNTGRRRRILSRSPMFLLVFFLLQLAACGGGSSSARPTPPGTYTITISGVSGSTTRTGTVTLVVN